jgi:hypothetical protein
LPHNSDLRLEEDLASPLLVITCRKRPYFSVVIRRKVMTSKLSRRVAIAGLVLMLVGALDPLEGSVIVLIGSALAAVAAFVGQSRRYRLQLIAVVLIAVGVAALFYLSSLGGVGGTTDRSVWWLAMCVTYPVGWIIGVVGAGALLREGRRAAA